MFDLVTGFILTSYLFCGIIKTQQKRDGCNHLCSRPLKKSGESQR